MFELRKSFTFEASHVLTGHNGKCARFHGHSYVLTLILRGRRLKRSGPQRNMLIDFCDVSAATKGLLASHLDHHHLNDTLRTKSPTAEFIARWIYRRLAPVLAPGLAAVELRETATGLVAYRPSRTTARRYAALAAAKAEEAAGDQLLCTGRRAVVNGFATGSDESDGDESGESNDHESSASEDEGFETQDEGLLRKILGNGCHAPATAPCASAPIAASDGVPNGNRITPGH